MSSESEPKTSNNSDPLIIKAEKLNRQAWFPGKKTTGKFNRHRHFYKRAIWKIIRTPAFIVFTPFVVCDPYSILDWSGHVTPSFTLVSADAEGLKQSNGEGEQLLKFLSDNHGCYVLWSHVQPSKIITIKLACPGSLCSLAFWWFLNPINYGFICLK